MAAAENLRGPWWLYLLVILLGCLLSGISAAWMTQRPDDTTYHQDPQAQRLIEDGRTLEHVWPKLNRTEQKKIERLAAQP